MDTPFKFASQNVMLSLPLKTGNLFLNKLLSLIIRPFLPPYLRLLSSILLSPSSNRFFVETVCPFVSFKAGPVFAVSFVFGDRMRKSSSVLNSSGIGILPIYFWQRSNLLAPIFIGYPLHLLGPRCRIGQNHSSFPVVKLFYPPLINCRPPAIRNRWLQ